MDQVLNCDMVKYSTLTPKQYTELTFSSRLSSKLTIALVNLLKIIQRKWNEFSAYRDWVISLPEVMAAARQSWHSRAQTRLLSSKRQTSTTSAQNYRNLWTVVGVRT